MSTISTFYPGDDVMAGAMAIAAILLLTALSLCVTLLLPRRPTTRHSLLLSALVCSLLTPLVAVALRSLEISTLVCHVATAERPATVPIAADPPHYTVAVTPPAQNRFPRRERARQVIAPPHESMPVLGPPPSSMPVMPAPPIDAAIVIRDDEPSAWQPAAPPLAAPTDSFNAPLAQPAQVARPPAPVAPKTTRQVPVALRGWLVLVLSAWIGISAVLLARVLLSGLWLVRLRRVCRGSSGDVPDAVLAEVRSALGVRRLPPILTCQRAKSPFAAGLFRPVVILPAGLAGRLASDELADVLTHECAHALRRDPAVRYLQAIAGGLFWPLPTIHLVNRQLAQAREEICDNYVLAQREPVAYAETLLKVAALVGRGEPTLAAVGILPRRGKLEARIAGLIAQRRSRATRGSRLGAICCLAILLLASAIACGTTVREMESKQPAPPAVAQNRAQDEERQRTIDSLQAKQEKIGQLAERFDRLMGGGRYLSAEAAPADKPSAEETAAAETYKLLSDEFKAMQSGGPEAQYAWSRRWMDAQIARNPSPAGRLEAAQAHAARMKELKSLTGAMAGMKGSKKSWSPMASYCVAEAERMVEAASAAVAASQSAIEPPAAEAAAQQPSADETAAAEVFKRLTGLYEKGRSEGPESQYVWSRRWMDAQIARNPSPLGRLEAAQAHAARMKELKAIAEKFVAAQQGTQVQVAMANYYVAEAERMVATASATRRQIMVKNGVKMERFLSPQGATPWRTLEQATGQSVADGGQTPETRMQVRAKELHLETDDVQLDVGPEDASQPTPAEPDGAESAELKIPTPDELLAIERRVIADRQKLHSGRLALAEYFPVPEKDGGRALQFTERFTLYFDGDKTRCDEIGPWGTLYKISTPTSFVRWNTPRSGASDQFEVLFEPGTPTPHASEVADARLLGLAFGSVGNLGQHTMEDVFPRQERTNVKIEAGTDEAAGPVLKVAYDVSSKQGNPVSVEYWLAPRYGYLPVYYTMSSSFEGVALNNTLRSKYARYHAAHEGDVWFPSEVDFRQKPTSVGALDPSRVVRVEGAEFNLVLPPLTFERRGVEQAERQVTDGRLGSEATRVAPTQSSKPAPLAGYARAPQTATPPPHGVPAGPDDGLTPCVATAEPPPAGAEPPPVPTAEELQKIEERILENRRSIRAGRLEVDQYTMLGDDPRALQVASHDLYDFKGGKVKEEHGLGWKKKTYLIRTPTMLARMGADGEVTEQVFEGGKQAPPADFNSRFMGFSSVGPSLAEWLAKPDRRNQKIVAAVEDGEPVLKVSFQEGDERSPEVEYWLAPRCDYLPVFTRRTEYLKQHDVAIRDSAIVKLARYQPVGIWFPTEIVIRREQLDANQTQWRQSKSPIVQRVKQAMFAIGPAVAESEEEDEPGYDPPTALPQASPRLSQPALPPSAPPPAAEPKATDGAARRPKATPAVGLLDPEGVSRLELRADSKLW